MDKPIPYQKIRRKKIRRIATGTGIAVAVLTAVYTISATGAPSVNRKDHIFHQADIGTIETSIPSTGHVEPAFEEAIVSPISSRIMELYLRPGDSVDAGTPIMRLDLTTIRAEVEKMNDAQSMKSLEREQMSLASATTLTNLEMRVKVKEMEVNRLEAEVTNERYLDSLGTGTGDRVREAVLRHRTTALELEQLRLQLDNERKSANANLRAKDIESGIALKNLRLQTQVLRDAEILSPRKGTITMLESGIGRPVNQGAHIATVADLSHFKIESSVAEAHVDKVRAGARAIVRVGRKEFTGRISNVTPQSSGGMIKFSVALDNDSDRSLRPGLRADVHIIWDIMDDVTRIPMLQTYNGPGIYYIYVLDDTGGYAERRTVTLGAANYDYIEVKSGLAPGQTIIANDMSMYNSSKLRIK